MSCEYALNSLSPARPNQRFGRRSKLIIFRNHDAKIWTSKHEIEGRANCDHREQHDRQHLMIIDRRSEAARTCAVRSSITAAERRCRSAAAIKDRPRAFNRVADLMRE